MGEFALVLTGLVLCLTAIAVVAQLLRWRAHDRAAKESRAAEVHDDPFWRQWADPRSDDEHRR